MAVYFHKTSQFEEIRLQIEDHLFNSVLEHSQEIEIALNSVESLLIPLVFLWICSSRLSDAKC